MPPITPSIPLAALSLAGDDDFMSYDPLDPEGDCFKPPKVPVEVHCLHCDREYDSYLIEWRIEEDESGKKHGFWCCPTPGCDGRGFGFDIFPTDPEYRDDDGQRMWVDDEDDDEDAEEWRQQQLEEDHEEDQERDAREGRFDPKASFDPEFDPDFDADKVLTDILKHIDDSLPATPEEERAELEEWMNRENEKPF